MGEQTGISWTNHTFNGWHGCTRVSPGCENCYAETFSKRPIHKQPDGSFGALDIWGPGKPRKVFGDAHWNEPLKWDAKAAKDGVIRKMFCFSMADIFDVDAPEGQLERFWELCRRTPHLIKQLLTKRAEGYAERLPEDLMVDPLIWKGITAEDQEWYGKRAPLVARLPGVWWVSYEPALGPIRSFGFDPAPDWLVFGGESGNGFRPVGKEWAKEVKELCARRGTKFFMKQWSARTPAEGKLLIPDFLNVQQFPRQ